MFIYSRVQTRSGAVRRVEFESRCGATLQRVAKQRARLEKEENKVGRNDDADIDLWRTQAPFEWRRAEDCRFKDGEEFSRLDCREEATR